VTFPPPIIVEYVDGVRWRMFHDAAYQLDDGRVSTVMRGFVHDFASIPPLLRGLAPSAGDGENRYGVAAIWHDWLYVYGSIEGQAVTRKDADDLFLEMMLALGVAEWRARTIYRAVRIFGARYWGRGTEGNREP
jgi:hypothetical protein